MPLTGSSVLLVTVVVILAFSTLLFVISRYKRCPSDRIMVIYGKVGQAKDGTALSAKCIHGGAAFVWPIFQAYEFLDLKPISISVDLKSALSRQNIRIDVPSSFTVGISTEPGVMQNAAERLLGLKRTEIQELAKDIIFGQLRLVIATMEIEEINTDRDKFLDAVSRNVETELKKIGLRLINVNVTDISDESGYIEALGKEAAAKAINDARKSVAERERDGAIGEANARREQRIMVAAADAEAIKGENESAADVAMSNAIRREREAEAKAEQARRLAKGEADAIFMKMEAEARGIQEILTKQALGYAQLVQAVGGDASKATQLMIADKIEDLIKVQVEAIKGIKIDKVTVWDGMNKDGTPATANFLSGMLKSIPPMNEMFKMAGMKLPGFLGEELEKEEEKPEESENTAAEAEPAEN